MLRQIGFVHGAAGAAKCLKPCRAANGAKRIGGEAGIRTLGTGLSPYNGLANRRFRPLSHLTASKLLMIAVIRLGWGRLRLARPDGGLAGHHVVNDSIPGAG